MFISDEEYDQRVEIGKKENRVKLERVPEAHGEVGKKYKGGGQVERHNMTEGQRAMVGILSQFESAPKLAKEFNIGENHVKELRHGRHNGELPAAVEDERNRQRALAEQEAASDEEIKELEAASGPGAGLESGVIDRVNNHVERIMEGALGGIDPDDVEDPMKKAKLAQTMGNLLYKLGNKAERNRTGLHRTIIFNTVNQKKEDDYSVIEVSHD